MKNVDSEVSQQKLILTLFVEFFPLHSLNFNSMEIFFHVADADKTFFKMKNWFLQ